MKKSEKHSLFLMIINQAVLSIFKPKNKIGFKKSWKKKKSNLMKN